jgi:hypothetical protein
MRSLLRNSKRVRKMHLQSLFNEGRRQLWFDDGRPQGKVKLRKTLKNQSGRETVAILMMAQAGGQNLH